MSHHVPMHDAIPIVASHAPTRSTMPTFLPEDAGAGVQGGAQRDIPAPTRPTMPTFLAEDAGTAVQREIDPARMADLFAEYQAYGPVFMDSLTFRDYLQVQYGIRSRDHHQGHRHHHDDHRAASRFHLPTFDGSSNSSAKS